MWITEIKNQKIIEFREFTIKITFPGSPGGDGILRIKILDQFSLLKKIYPSLKDRRNLYLFFKYSKPYFLVIMFS
jgi:hypothetical protein